jgi:abortive infection bacteriophage resistance protein
MAILQPTKPHSTYSDQVTLLESRGMIIPDHPKAERKLSQIGYYRLSGFWYPCRQFDPTNRGLRLDNFQQDINFNEIIQLYLFDKKLRLLMIDAIERIEIHTRSVIAHEIGFHNPLGYYSSHFINPRKMNFFEKWIAVHTKRINESREECIQHHKRNGKKMPFWVIIESWDFGTMSKYFENLKWSYQDKICQRMGISDPNVFLQWIRAINILRNKCAHHARIWNFDFRNPLPTLPDPYFVNMGLDSRALRRMFGLISILWFLVNKIGSSSNWLESVSNLVDTKPAINSCPNTAMGFSDNAGFPKHLF